MKLSRIILCLTLCIILALSAACAEYGITVVSLGDSYSSGEGVEPFYGQELPLEEKVHDQDWLAHRSEKSWPGQLRFQGLDGTLSQHRGTYTQNSDGSYSITQDGNWFFVAASGALSANLTQPMEKPVNIREKGFSIRNTMYLYPQLSVFDALAASGRRADYVTVTLGGNDIGFPDLMAAAVFDGPMFSGVLSKLTQEDSGSLTKAAIDSVWEAFYEEGSVRETIKNAYLAIAEAAGEQATIIVAGYPVIISEYGKTFAGGESARLLAKATHRFNSELEAIVEELQGEGVNICFVSVEEEFAGKEAYSPDEAYINELILGSLPQDLSSRAIFSMYSFHPNELGTAAYARCVQAKIDELEAAQVNSGAES